DHKLWGPRLFEGLSATHGLIVDAVGRPAPAQLAQLRKEMESAFHSRPTTLLAMHLCLDRLATCADDLIRGLGGDSESPATRWACAFARQCRDALDELLFLAPWILLPGARNVGIEGIPTLRELSILESATLPAIEKDSEFVRLLNQSSLRAGERMAAIEELA